MPTRSRAGISIPAPPPPGVDAIIVLGCSLDERGAPTEALQQRVALAVTLYRGGAAPLVVLSGGGNASTSEAEAMRRLALAAGVPAAALLVEPASRDTLENALYAARLLRERGKTRVVLVSDRWHLPRAALLFRLAGLRVTGRAGVRLPAGRSVLRLAHEAGALPWSLARALLRRTR